MADLVSSNIDDLVKTIRSDIQGMFGSPEMEQAGRNAYDIMYKNVRNRMKTTGYDYDQSGRFKEAMDDEKKGFDKDSRTKNSMNIGFGYIGEGEEGLNDSAFMREQQQASFYIGHGHLRGNWITMNLKAETQMPKWIVLEFGTKDKADAIPDSFKVSYSPRPDRSIMFGPSDGAPTGLKKHIYMMVDPKNHAKIGNGNWYSSGDENDFSDANKHPGVRPGRFFRNGLEDSKLPIYDALGEGLSKYLDRINN